MRTKLMLLLLVVALLCLVIACGGDDDSTATPTLNAEPFEVADGVFAHLEDPPPLPEGSVALSKYYVFEAPGGDSAIATGVAIDPPQESTLDVGFYSYVNGEWRGVIGAINLDQGGTVLQAVFPRVPENLIALRTSGDTPPPLGGPPLR